MFVQAKFCCKQNQADIVLIPISLASRKSLEPLNFLQAHDKVFNVIMRSFGAALCLEHTNL